MFHPYLCRRRFTLKHCKSCVSPSFRNGAEHLDERHVPLTPLPGQPCLDHPALLPALPLCQRVALQPAHEPRGQHSWPALPLLGGGSPPEAHGHRSLGGAAGPGAGRRLSPRTHPPGQLPLLHMAKWKTSALNGHVMQHGGSDWFKLRLFWWE